MNEIVGNGRVATNEDANGTAHADEPGTAPAPAGASPDGDPARCWFCGSARADAEAAFEATFHERRPAGPGGQAGDAAGTTGPDGTQVSRARVVAVQRCRRCHRRHRRAWVGYLLPVGTVVAVPVVLVSGMGLVLPVLLWLALFAMFGMRDGAPSSHEMAATHPDMRARLDEGWHLARRA